MDLSFNLWVLSPVVSVESLAEPGATGWKELLVGGRASCARPDQAVKTALKLCHSFGDDDPWVHVVVVAGSPASPFCAPERFRPGQVLICLATAGRLPEGPWRLERADQPSGYVVNRCDACLRSSPWLNVAGEVGAPNPPAHVCGAHRKDSK